MIRFCQRHEFYSRFKLFILNQNSHSFKNKSPFPRSLTITNTHETLTTLTIKQQIQKQHKTRFDCAAIMPTRPMANTNTSQVQTV